MEAVHLAQQLVDGLVGIRVQHAVGPFRTDRVDLVDEDDAGRPLLGRLCNTTKVSLQRDRVLSAGVIRGAEG